MRFVKEANQLTLNVKHYQVEHMYFDINSTAWKP